MDKELEELITKLKGGCFPPQEEHLDAFVQLLKKLKVQLERIEQKLINFEDKNK